MSYGDNDNGTAKIRRHTHKKKKHKRKGKHSKAKRSRQKTKNKFILQLVRTLMNNTEEHLEVDIHCKHQQLYPNNTFVRDLVTILNEKNIKVINNGRVFERNRVTELAQDPKTMRQTEAKVLKKLEVEQRAPVDAQTPQPPTDQSKDKSPLARWLSKKHKKVPHPVPIITQGVNPVKTAAQVAEVAQVVYKQDANNALTDKKIIIEDFVEVKSAPSTTEPAKVHRAHEKKRKHKRKKHHRTRAPEPPPTPEIVEMPRMVAPVQRVDDEDTSSKADSGPPPASVEDVPMTAKKRAGGGGEISGESNEVDSADQSEWNSGSDADLRTDDLLRNKSRSSRRRMEDATEQTNNEVNDESDGPYTQAESKSEPRLEELRLDASRRSHRAHAESPLKVVMKSNLTFNLGDEFFRWRANDAVTDILGELAIPTNTSMRATPPLHAWVKPLPKHSEETKRSSGEKHSTEKHSAEKHSAEKHRAKKHSTERHSAEKHSVEKHSVEKHRAEKHSAEKHSTEKHSTEKHIPEKHSEKHSARKHSVDKQSTENHSAEKHSAEIYSAERKPSEESRHSVEVKPEQNLADFGSDVRWKPSRRQKRNVQSATKNNEPKDNSTTKPPPKKPAKKPVKKPVARKPTKKSPPKKKPAARKAKPVKKPAARKEKTVKKPIARKGKPMKKTATRKANPVKKPAARKAKLVKKPAARKAKLVKKPAARKGKPVKKAAARKGKPIKKPAARKAKVVKKPAARKGKPLKKTAARKGKPPPKSKPGKKIPARKGKPSKKSSPKKATLPLKGNPPKIPYLKEPKKQASIQNKTAQPDKNNTNVKNKTEHKENTEQTKTNVENKPTAETDARKQEGGGLAVTPEPALSGTTGSPDVTTPLDINPFPSRTPPTVAWPDIYITAMSTNR